MLLMRRQIWLILLAARLTAAASFLLLGVVHLDDVAVNRHLAEICAHVPGAELRHLVLDEPPLLLGDAELDADRSCAFGHVAIRLLQTTTDNFLRIGGDTRKNIPFPYFNGQFRAKTWYLFREKFLSHFTTNKFSAFVHSCAKSCCSLYNGHSFQPISGYDRQKILIRKVPLTLQRTVFCCLSGLFKKSERSLLLYNGQYFMDWGVSPKKSFHFTTDIFSEKNRGLPEKSENKMLPALEKAEASCSADMRFERTASTAAVRTQRRNERSGLSASLPICSCWEHPNPY